MTHGHFDMGYSESTFSKYAFGRGEGVTKKSTLCTLEKMMTIMDDPLGPNIYLHIKYVDEKQSRVIAFISQLIIASSTIVNPLLPLLSF